ncbi:MAG: hypothetical protein J2P37_15440 [Ktedonobacteraceae bacterium]|nr:hypothetical protein [Ktedonobacteraceae bacterium]
MSDQSSGQVREGQNQRTRAFNPNEHLIQLKGKDYLPVQWRLVWFRERFPQGTIETEMLHLDLDRETEEEAMAWNPEKRRSEKVIKQARGFVIFRAVVKDGLGGIATGTKSEKAASFPDYVEKAETGAIGRALAALGYGTQFTGDEFEEEHRIVDSPVDRGNGTYANGSGGNNTFVAAARPGSGSIVAESNEQTGVTEQQLASIRKLCQHLGKPEPENVAAISALSARRLIQQLTAEYREQKRGSKAS